ncbi:MAG: DNA mismatch repair protein MutL [Desulfobacterium sp.]|nr:DNA mismatch repair protein MutL [Desulfobacterium sp.]
MSRIQILPDILSNKIAAGEVVERPSSVVKELLENSIDANSSRIIIDIENGGRSLIRISDNGSGMNRDDAMLSIERYATSKIRTDSDLYSIKTLGFRGEALPSIASVSQFSLITRDEFSETGTQILIDGGKIKSVTEVGTSVGTMIDVKNLFYNTPARRKFLKSTNAEMGHIADTLSGIALGRPEIGFQLVHNGKMVKKWPVSSNPLDRISAVFGQDIRGGLHKIELETENASVFGWISSPSITQSTSQKIYLYVNGRFIRDRGLQHALFEGYQGRLMKGRFPIAVLFIKVPFEQLDVNVHPAKHEIRFAGYRYVHETLKAAVFKAWNIIDHIKPEPVSIEIPTHNHISRIDRSSAALLFSQNRHEAKEIPFQAPFQKTTFTYDEPSEKETISEKQSLYSASINSTVQGKSRPQQANYTDYPGAQKDPYLSTGILTPLRVIGQLYNTYIICESENEFILFDQHAAHERILFEQLKRKAQKSGSPAQKLLIPEIIDFGYSESAILEKLLPGLLSFGLEIEPFGGNTFAVKAIPSLISDKEVKPFIVEMVEKISDIGFADGIEKTIDDCLIMMACHGAIRANQALSEKEMKGIIDQLALCENPSHCPHGRPIRISWPISELEKKFKRIL